MIYCIRKVVVSMIMYPFYLLFVLLFIRLNTSYHPQLLFRKYRIIRSPWLGKLLISQQKPGHHQRINDAANRNKLLIAGMVFYGLFLALLLLWATLALLPDVPVTPFELHTKTLYFTGNSLRDLLPLQLTVALLCAALGFEQLNTWRITTRVSEYRRLTIVFQVAMIALGSIGFVCAMISSVMTVVRLLL